MMTLLQGQIISTLIICLIKPVTSWISSSRFGLLRYSTELLYYKEFERYVVILVHDSVPLWRFALHAAPLCMPWI